MPGTRSLSIPCSRDSRTQLEPMSGKTDLPDEEVRYSDFLRTDLMDTAVTDSLRIGGLTYDDFRCVAPGKNREKRKRKSPGKQEQSYQIGLALRLTRSVRHSIGPYPLPSQRDRVN